MAIVAVDLGSSPTGAGGDTNREAFTKLNASVTDLDGRSAADQYATEAISGGAGFTNATGVIALDLSTGRAFHNTMTGNITGLSFTNVPTVTEYAAQWTWVLAINATGGYSLTGTPTVTFVDGLSWGHLDLSADAVNVVTFWRIGAITYAAVVTNGDLALDPYKVCFLANGSVVIMAEAEDIDVANDSQDGDGTITYERNGAAITTRTAFSAGDRLTVICAGLTTTTSVRVPRYA